VHFFLAARHALQATTFVPLDQFLCLLVVVAVDSLLSIVGKGAIDVVYSTGTLFAVVLVSLAVPPRRTISVNVR